MLNGGDLRLGGQFAISDIGLINNLRSRVAITGTLLAAGQTLAITPAHGEWRLEGGRFENGTISLAAGSTFHILEGRETPGWTPGTLKDANVSGDFEGMLDARLEGTVQFLDDVRPIEGPLPGEQPSIDFADGAVLSRAMIAAAGRLNILGPAGGSATLGANVSIVSTTPGIGLRFYGGPIVNRGAIRLEDGIIQVPGKLVNRGLLELLAGSQLDADGATSDVRYQQLADGTLRLHLAGLTTGLIGRIRIGLGDEVALGGTLIVEVDAGFVPQSGDSIRVIDRISAGNPPAVLSGNFATVQKVNVPVALSVVLDLLSPSLNIRFQ